LQGLGPSAGRLRRPCRPGATGRAIAGFQPGGVGQPVALFPLPADDRHAAVAPSAAVAAIDGVAAAVLSGSAGTVGRSDGAASSVSKWCRRHTAQHLGNARLASTGLVKATTPNSAKPYVWTPNQISLLVDSLIRGWPFGTLLMWKVGQGDLKISRTGSSGGDVVAADFKRKGSDSMAVAG